MFSPGLVTKLTALCDGYYRYDALVGAPVVRVVSQKSWHFLDDLPLPPQQNLLQRPRLMYRL